MRKSKPIVQYRRKRQGKTNYKKRLRFLIAKKPRLCVRKSLKGVTAQIVDYSPEGDKVLGGVNSKALVKYGWKLGTANTASAYLTGYLAGKLAKDKGVKDAILDIGFNKPVKGAKVYAVLKGVIDAGINVPHSGDVLPSEERINGANLKSKDVPDVKSHFEEVKSKITGAKNEQ